MSRIWDLILTEAKIELRERTALTGILLYVLSSAFIVFSIWRQLPPREWGLSFWIVFLFCSLMAILKTFGKESEARYLYYYTLYHPLELFVTKVIYNCMLLVCIFLLQWLVMSIMAGDHIVKHGWFLFTGVLASIGFSILLTFISSLAIKTQQSASMTAILALPLMIPIILNVLRLTAYSLGTTPDDNPWNEVTLTSSVIALISGMSLWLFPYLWRS